MDKSVFDKIVENAERILTDETPIDKRIEFCQSCVDTLVGFIPKFYLERGFYVEEYFWPRKCSPTCPPLVADITPCWDDYMRYLDMRKQKTMDGWMISSINPTPESVQNGFNVKETDGFFYELLLYEVFSNEKRRLEQLKAMDCLEAFLSPQEQENDNGEATQPPQQENSLEQEKKAEILQFYADRDENVYEQIFTALKSKGYLANDCPLEDWLYICGIKQYNQPQKPIEWIKLQNELMWVVATLFRPHNENDYWAIAESCFTIKGEKINRKTMITTHSRYISGGEDKLPKPIKELQGIIDDVLSGAKW